MGLLDSTTCIALNETSALQHGGESIAVSIVRDNGDMVAGFSPIPLDDVFVPPDSATGRE